MQWKDRQFCEVIRQPWQPSAVDFLTTDKKFKSRRFIILTLRIYHCRLLQYLSHTTIFSCNNIRTILAAWNTSAVKFLTCPNHKDLPPKDTLPLNTQGGGIYWEQNVGVTSIKYPLLPIFSGTPTKYPLLLIYIFDFSIIHSCIFYEFLRILMNFW